MTRSAVKIEPPLEDWPAAGVYQLHIHLARGIQLLVGRLGRVRLPAGDYVYTGRARRGLAARIRRHIIGGQRRHWHIDYLLASRGARLRRVTLASTDPADECRVNQRVVGSAPIPRFGASDCRAGCAAHLIRITGPSA